MPNYVKTRIKMKGISELPIFSEDRGKRFLDFNKIISMPKELDIEQGTKWNSCSTDIIDKDTVEIQTAWSYPEPIIVKISQMCPDSVVEILWADEDMGYNSGCRFCKDGIFFKGGEYKNCSNESYEAYTSLFKESNCLYKDDKGNWKKRNCEDCSGC